MCWPDEVEDLCGKLRKFMTRAVEVNFDQMIIGVDFKVGDNWGEMEKI